MSTCDSHNALDCDCTTSSLAPLELTLPKNGNDFPFVAFNGGTNIQVNQTPAGIVISSLQSLPRAYVGYTTQNLNARQFINPVIFTDNTIPGAVNTGTYNPTTGETLIPNTGLYSISVQFITQFVQPFSNAEFTRGIYMYVNGVDSNNFTFKISFSNQTITVSANVIMNLAAGDILTIGFDVGAAIPFTILGGINSYFSIKELYA